MAVMPTPITPLPTPPTRSDPVNFSDRADAFLVGVPIFATETNAISVNVYDNATEAFNSATAAGSSASAAFDHASAAAVSASAAAAVAGATLWVSGTTYAQGAVVYSPITYLSYRRKTAGAGSTDPSLDATNWVLIGTPGSFPVLVISTNTTALTNTHYVISAALTLTLPASPNVGATVQWTDISRTRSCIVNPGIEKIKGVSGNMTLNTNNTGRTIVYTGSTYGWV